jgi:nucleotide-binding universal stress UspA family protein
MLDYENILFCTDFSDDANIAFVHAVNLANRYSAALHIIHIPHSPFTYTRHVVDENIPEGKGRDGQAFFDEAVAEESLKRLREAYEPRMGEFTNHRFVVRCGSPDIEIIRYAKENDIDLIVMGALGKAEYDKLVHGSTVANVSKYAHCHVMAIRNPARQFTLPGKMG